MSIKTQLKRSLGIILQKDRENAYAIRNDRAQIFMAYCR